MIAYIIDYKKSIIYKRLLLVYEQMHYIV
ncbi:hypothetical protein JV46_23550 [Solemya velum gill symbiont]|uniref:Uncharacterized protein n=1 Tax=Solemya velum gill symbiont TaxID=2340 RepID=A0A0B0H8Y1_SOVGS|nr:hypothetical protein JV46_23550 [Solemya velum gill symbiont]